MKNKKECKIKCMIIKVNFKTKQYKVYSLREWYQYLNRQTIKAIKKIGHKKIKIA